MKAKTLWKRAGKPRQMRISEASNGVLFTDYEPAETTAIFSLKLMGKFPILYPSSTTTRSTPATKKNTIAEMVKGLFPEILHGVKRKAVSIEIKMGIMLKSPEM
jgi:hypothetical protein